MDEPAETKEEEESAPVVASPPEAVVLPNPEPERTQQQEESAPKQQRLTDKLAGFSSVFEALVAISAIVGVVLIVYQVRYMGESNELTRRSVEATERALKLTEESNRLTREGLEESERQAEAALAQSRAESEVEQQLTREALAETRRTFEVSQRARLVVDEFQFPEREDGSVVAVAIIKNTGLLTATNVRWRADVRFGGSSTELLSDPIWASVGHSQTALGSGSTLRIEHLMGGSPPDYIVMGLTFFFGRVDYLDGFGKERSLGFCQFYGPLANEERREDWRWRPCFAHTWAENEPEDLRRYREEKRRYPDPIPEPSPEPPP